MLIWGLYQYSTRSQISSGIALRLGCGGVCCNMEHGCCHIPEKEGHAHPEKRMDYLLWVSVTAIIPGYLAQLLAPEFVATIPYFNTYAPAVFEFLNKMWWGLALGIFFVGILDKIPRELIISVLGRGGNLRGVLRATLAGVLLDLCSHGILLVGMKLYERGASLGQIMAFLIASPWNSFSLTLILWALIGFKLTLAFIVFSMVIAIISGVLFDTLVKKDILPKNPNHMDLPEGFAFFPALKQNIKNIKLTPKFFRSVAVDGIKDSEMVLRWIFFGVVLTALIRTFLPEEHFGTFFGPTVLGLGATLLVATIMEICSEGSAPIAADLVTRAAAPGNAFAFMMAGISTDYTEIMALKETTKSWKIALFLPLVTVPQVVFIAWLMNYYG